MKRIFQFCLISLGIVVALLGFFSCEKNPISDQSAQGEPVSQKFSCSVEYRSCNCDDGCEQQRITVGQVIGTWTISVTKVCGGGLTDFDVCLPSTVVHEMIFTPTFQHTMAVCLLEEDLIIV